LKPFRGLNSPWDRPWLSFDDKTGTVYLYSSGGQTTIDTGSPDKRRTQSYFTVSHDQGSSFGVIRAVDSLEWPQAGRASLAAGLGSLAVVYVASKVPASEGAMCPCEVFAISRDEGKTFERHVMKNIAIAAAPGAQVGSPRGGDGSIGNLIADPTTQGRFTAMRYLLNPNPHLEFSTSNDDGKNWSAFVPVAGVPGAAGFEKSVARYSRWGVIGAVWKADYPDSTFDLWSTISKDGGRTFSAPLRISHAVSPARNYYRDSQQDDTCGLDLSKDDLYTLWGDTRAGFQASWFGKVSLASYRF
jgi:hypothetical protein